MAADGVWRELPKRHTVVIEYRAPKSSKVKRWFHDVPPGGTLTMRMGDLTTTIDGPPVTKKREE